MKAHGKMEAILKVVAQIILVVKVDKVEAGVMETKLEVHQAVMDKVVMVKVVMGKVKFRVDGDVDFGM